MYFRILNTCLEEFDNSETLLPRPNEQHFWCEAKKGGH